MTRTKLVGVFLVVVSFGGILLGAGSAGAAQTGHTVAVPLSPPVVASAHLYSREIISAPAGKHCGERIVPDNSEISLGGTGCSFNHMPAPSQYFATVVLKTSGAPGVVGLEYQWKLWKWTLDSAGNATGVALLLDLGTTKTPTVNIPPQPGELTAFVPCFLTVENAALKHPVGIWSGQCMEPNTR